MGIRGLLAGLAVAFVAAGCGSKAAVAPRSMVPVVNPPPTASGVQSQAPVQSTVPPPVTSVPPAPVRPVAAVAGSVPVISDAGNSILFDAEPAIRAALGASPFFPHTIGGFGLSVQPEVWQGVFGNDVGADKPAVVVVLMGNRDFEAAIGDPLGYQSTVDQAVRLVTASGTRVLWLGLPPLPPSVTDEAGRRAVNAIYSALPARFPGLVRYVSLDDVLGAGGVWARTLPTDGTDQLVRKVKPDGTPEEHLCQGGAVRVAELIRSQLADIVQLPAAPANWQQGAWRAEPRYNDPVGACQS